ncbi:MAG TPA: SWIM zinc finger family protein [Nitrososphaeraceae archaeon]
MINELNYTVRSQSSNNAYTVIAAKSGWTCSCPDYTRNNAKCEHVYAVEF